MLLLRARARWAFALGMSMAVARVGAAQDTVTVKTLSPVETHGFLEIYYRSGDPLTKDGYRLRKADLKLSGWISEHLRWRVTFDASKALAVTKTTASNDTAALGDVAVDQRSRMLQDAALTYTFNKSLALDIGQQIVPLSLEGTIATWNVETIERTNFIVERSRAVGLGDVRDIGVSANGQTAGLEYHVGLFNEMGDSQGTIDQNDQKAVMARVAYHIPAFPRFQIGGSGGFEGGSVTQERQRAATEIQYRDSRFMLRAETMAARDGLLRRFGWYGLGAMRPRTDLQLVARFDNWDRDRTGESSLSNAVQRQITGGVSYFIEGGTAKVALNLVHQTFPNIRSVRDATFGLLAFQAVW